jgi:hypothetical protein
VAYSGKKVANSVAAGGRGGRVTPDGRVAVSCNTGGKDGSFGGHVVGISSVLC